MSSNFAAIADALESDWQSIARREQLPPPGDEWNIWLILAGRGWGKSRTGAEWVRLLAEAATVERIALVGPTAADTRDVMAEGTSGILAISPNSFRPLYEPSKRRLTWPNGVQATMYSSEEPERLRGQNAAAAWCDELGAWRNVRETWDQLQFGLRLGKRPRQVVTTTPRPIKLLRELLQRPDVAVTRGRTYDNAANLAPSFLSEIVRRYEGTRIGRQELNAELLDDVPGALWNRDMIEATRLPAERAECIEFSRIVVAVDPSGARSADDENADSQGIVVAGLGVDGRGYILADRSCLLSPSGWGERVVQAYRDFGADRVVAERNFGGAMVEHVIRTVDPNISYREVVATSRTGGKRARAEPIAALYEQKRVSHVGVFPELEDELCSFSPVSTSSPDRLDALVWALTELMITGDRPLFVFG